MSDEVREQRVPPEMAGDHLDAVVRRLHQLSWGEARRLIRRGKVFVDGELEREGRRPVAAGAAVELRRDAPRLSEQGPHLQREAVIHLDRHLVVVRKPPGQSTVPYDQERAGGTLFDDVRRLLSKRQRARKGRRGALPSLHVVQRLDRGTSGVMVFVRTAGAAEGLRDQFRRHTVHRRYLAVVHRRLTGVRSYRSHLLADRGDGLRGSRERARRPELRRGRGGKLAVTHLEPVEPLAGATLVKCRLETGRTHQIRIHLSEAGSPVVGETLYLRDFAGEPIDAPRLMLHAGELGFRHPVTGAELRFDEPLPQDMKALIDQLR